jgi:multiple antibiotic resistance protein
MTNVGDEFGQLAKAIVLVVAALFPIVNPFGGAAIFVDMTGPIDERLRDVLSRKISTFSFLLLIGSMLLGARVLTFFGVTLYAVRIGGRLVVAATGWSLLTESGSGATS